MKIKLYVISALVILSLTLGACTPQVKDVVDDVVEEVEEVVEEVKEVVQEVVEEVVDKPEDEAAEEAGKRKTTENSDERYPKIVIGVASDPQDLNPWDYNVGSKPYFYHNIYETLFDEHGGDYLPNLAKGYKEIDDLHWEVELYDYIYDWNGNHITADDILYAYESYVEGGYAVKYDMYEGVEKVDDYTVLFTWTRPIDRVGDLEHPFCRTIIYSKDAFESTNFATNPVGTGVYKVTEFVSGSKVVMEANDDYWQTDESKINQYHQRNVQTIEVHVIGEHSQHVIALQTGAIDVSELVPIESLDDFRDGGKFDDDFDVRSETGSQLFAFYHNMDEGRIGADPNFRLATYYSIDNEAISKATGGLVIAAKAYGTPFLWDFVDAWMDEPNYMNTYDPALAKEYLAKTSYNGETLKLLGPVTEPLKTITTVVQAMLESVGIKTEIELMEAKSMGPVFTDPESHDLLIGTHGGGSQIGEWNRALNYNELGNDKSYGFIHDETLQDLFEKASNNATHNDETMSALHNYILDQAYYYAICSPVINLVHTSKMYEPAFRRNEFLMPGGSNYYFD